MGAQQLSFFAAFPKSLKAAAAAQHSTACHNTSGRVRIAAQNRWAPFWLNWGVPGQAQSGRAHLATGLKLHEWEALPPALQPLLR